MPLLRRAKPPASSSPDSVISTPPTSTPWDPPPLCHQALRPKSSIEEASEPYDLAHSGVAARARARRRQPARPRPWASRRPLSSVLCRRTVRRPQSVPRRTGLWSGPASLLGLLLPLMVWTPPPGSALAHSLSPPPLPSHLWHVGGAVASPALLGGITWRRLAAPVAAAVGPGPTQSYPGANLSEPPRAAPVEPHSTRRRAPTRGASAVVVWSSAARRPDTADADFTTDFARQPRG